MPSGRNTWEAVSAWTSYFCVVRGYAPSVSSIPRAQSLSADRIDVVGRDETHDAIAAALGDGR